LIRKLAYQLWMLGFIVVALERREVFWCTAAGAIGLVAQVVAARAWRTERGKVALANLVTLVRLALVVGLPLLLAWLPRGLFVALVVALLVLDGVDGTLARTRGEASAFGAALDMETDALTVMVLVILLWQDGPAGAWVLVAGLWRYAYAAAVAIVPALGDCPPSPIYRWIFTSLMIAFAGAFLPWAPLALAFAAIGTALVSFSFLHSLVRSRAFRGSARP
jgi:phosphatidylglycerophosphate synthase